MSPRIGRKVLVLVLVVIPVLVVSAGLLVYIQFFWGSYPEDLKILVVTGEGLQETYGFHNVSHTSNTYTYYRDEFWTESTQRWAPSTTAAIVSLDASTKVRGDFSILFDFNAYYRSYFLFHRTSYPYGYLAKEGDKWLYFSIMMDKTEQINYLEVRARDFAGNNYFYTQYMNASHYPPNEWIRFKIDMNNLLSSGTPNWSNIYGLQFNVEQSSGSPVKVWIDDIMITSNYHYELALKNLRALFKGTTIDVRDYDKLPSSLNDYTALIYFDNRINSTGISLIDQYVNRGGGLILMGLSTLWQSDGTERIDFPLSSSPVSILNSTETFITKAEKVDSFEDHPALEPWSNYAIFQQRGFALSRPYPYLGIVEVYNVSIRANATPLVLESKYIYEATKQYGAGKVIYFAENLAKRIANGMLEAYALANGFGSLGWVNPTGDRLQLLESAVGYISKQPIPKFLTIPDAKKGGFLFTVETSASINFYFYLNESCTNIIGSPSNDTAFWYTVERMRDQSEQTGVTFTLLIATEQLANEYRANQTEIEFNPKNIEALIASYQSPNIEIGLSTSNIMRWVQDAKSIDNAYLNMWQGVLDIRNALNLSNYEPLIWRYPGLLRGGESMFGTEKTGLYLDVTDESYSGGIPYSDSGAVPYMMEADTWKLLNRASFVPRVEGSEVLRRREEAYFDWYVESDMLYAVHSDDLTIAADPTHIHQEIAGTRNYSSKWSQIPVFLEYVSAQRENTWIVGGVTLAQYLRSWTAAEVSTTYNSKTRTYTFTISNPPDGLTVRLPLNGLHLNTVTSEVDCIIREQGDYAYVAVKNPKSLETVTVTVGSTKSAGTVQASTSDIFEAYPFIAAAPAFLQQFSKASSEFRKKSRSFVRVDSETRRAAGFILCPDLYHSIRNLLV